MTAIEPIRSISSPSEQTLRVDLAAAHRIAVMDGLNEGTWNHLSAMLPDAPGLMLITPGNTHWSQVSASNLLVMDKNNTVVAGDTDANGAAWIIHYPVHQARPDANCIMHAHPPYATALSMRKNWTLDTQCCQAAASFHDDVAYFDVYDGVLREASEGARMADALGDKRILLLRNHGVLVAGKTIAQAYLDLYQLERAAMFQLLAAGDGLELNKIPESVARKMGERARSTRDYGHFEAMKKVLERNEPDYTD